MTHKAARRSLLHAALVLPLAARSGIAWAEDLSFDLQIERGHLSGGPQVISVHQGDHVTLRLSTDRAIVLHLHGYDIETRVEPGTMKEVSFEAYATGRFPIHVHARNRGAGAQAQEDTPLGYLEVYPR